MKNDWRWTKRSNRRSLEKQGIEEVQELINKYNKIVDEKLKIKEQELMTV